MIGFHVQQGFWTNKEKFVKLKDFKGKDTKLQAGCTIVFHIERKEVYLKDKDGIAINWNGRSGKRELPRCVQSEEDFVELLLFVADTHGLRVEQSHDCVGGPSFTFHT